ncbi:MAG: type II toxin-antitoxin system RelE/ParE family toxin [Desulfobacteraceae bacterium]|nr:type II toxin-antitoxin system RelE/ParE family toxin [Desulfobacteraceae bacterium]
MIQWKIRLTPEATKTLSKLHPENKKIIKAALKQIRQSPYSGTDLQEELSGLKSFKPKRYRILYKINEEEQSIEIYYIGHRRDVYEHFKRLLNRFSTHST